MPLVCKLLPWTLPVLSYFPFLAQQSPPRLAFIFEMNGNSSFLEGCAGSRYEDGLSIETQIEMPALLLAI